MMKPLVHSLAVAALALACIVVVRAQQAQLPIGVWAGTVRNLAAAERNQQARPASLTVARVKDPHALWRGGTGEMVTVNLRLQQQTYEVGVGEFTDNRLVLSFTQPEFGEPVTCTLLKQKDGSYEGDCVGPLQRRVMLTPPPPAPEKQ